MIIQEKLLEKPKDEIEVKIEENIRMRDGITKLLGGCHDTRQAMDIGKNLLTINSRILSLMSSLQKKRSSNILKDFNKGQGLVFVEISPQSLAFPFYTNYATIRQLFLL